MSMAIGSWKGEGRLASVLAGIAVTAMFCGVVVKASEKIWWPYVYPDQIVIEPNVGQILAEREKALKDDERFQVTNFINVTADNLQVVTGATFTSMTAEAPVKSYCYASLPLSGGQKTVNLASRQGSRPIDYLELTVEQAALVDRTPDELTLLARRACRWLETKANSKGGKKETPK